MPPSIDPILLRPIEELGINASTAELLKGKNIYYVGDLAQLTEAELLNQSFSANVILEIRMALWSRGLDLGRRFP